MTPGFWRGKRVFITGHTGFKGSWLSQWLKRLGAETAGYALSPATIPNLFMLADVADGMRSTIGDIRDGAALGAALNDFRPDILIHMAAQPLVRRSYADPAETYSTNVMGTIALFEAVRRCESIRVVVNVTTDKCYENREWLWGYREDEAMGGYDPYSSSKACAELVTKAYRCSFFATPEHPDRGPRVATARAGNVIGGGDWSEDRLIPDILRAFERGEAVVIRSPRSVRPWQHVLEPLSGYLRLAEHLWEKGTDFAEAWNFGPATESEQPVSYILDALTRLWGNGARWELATGAQPHEAHLLKLDSSKARSRLHWAPRWTIDEALASVVAWHRGLLAGGSARELIQAQIDLYEQSRAPAMSAA